MSPFALALLKRLIPFAIAAVIGFGMAWAIQGLRITAAEQEVTAAEQAHKDYVQQLTQESQDAKAEADRQRDQAQRDYAAASKQLEDAIARGDALSRCIAAGKCRGMPKQPVCASGSTAPVSPAAGVDDASADAVFAAASVADEGVIADCARTTLQINRLQANIKAQKGYAQ